MVYNDGEGLSENLQDEEKRAAEVIARGTGDVEVARDSLKLQAELKWLARKLERLAEPVFGPFEKHGDQVSLPVRDNAGIGKMIFSCFAEMLTRMDAPNYVQIGGWHPEAGRLELIIQRVGKLSPHEARVEAERHLDRAVALLAEHGIVWDGPTSFPPDMPAKRDIPIGQDWLTIDPLVQPNDLVCSRCKTRQPMPERGTATVLNAMIAAFAERHGECREGDDRG